MHLDNVEFYGTPNGQVMIVAMNMPLRIYEMGDSAFTSQMIDTIREFYPEAFEALCSIYISSKQNRLYFEYLIVHRFIRCNFFEYDNRADINNLGTFQFEFVSCPMRGECKFCEIICMPKFNSKLSRREVEVMKLYYQSFDAEYIADQLFISIETVKNHKRNSLKKLKLHSLSDFISYASRTKMFD